MTNIRIATRGSKLALWQANHVKALLEAKGHTCELNIIKTTGDKILDKPLYDVGGKSLFIKELETALANKEADIAVHSLKDVSANLAKGFTLPAILPRHSFFDIIIFERKLFDQQNWVPGEYMKSADWRQLTGKTVGTSSLRRAHCLKSLNPQIKVESLRGNIDTRLEKLTKTGNFTAIILAEASLERLDLLDDYPYLRLDLATFTPCAGQGAIAIECLEESIYKDICSSLNDGPTSEAVVFERAIIDAIGADCQTPVGVLAEKSNKDWNLHFKISDHEGNVFSWHKTAPTLDNAIRAELISVLHRNPGQKILENLGLVSK